MDDRRISAIHIQQLTHRNPEVREAALLSIISKLNTGYKLVDLSRSKSILNALFSWFSFSPCSKEKQVLSLINRILSSEFSSSLIAQYGKADLITQINKIKSFINPELINDVEEIINTLNKDEVNLLVDNDKWLDKSTLNVLKNAWPSTDEPLINKKHNDKSLIELYHHEYSSNNNNNNKLKWQELNETDRNILYSVEKSLKNPKDVSALFHSCDFFINILLHDFPAEIFLQRSNIVLELLNLLHLSKSTRLANAIFECLTNLTKCLQRRVDQSNDPCMNCLIDEIQQYPTELNDHHQTPSNNQNDEDNVQFDNVTALKCSQLTISDYCFQTIEITLKWMIFNQDNLDKNKAILSQMGFNLALSLLNDVFSLLNRVTDCNWWSRMSNVDELKFLNDFDNILKFYSETIDCFRIEAKKIYQYRILYLNLVALCVNWLSKFVPPAQAQKFLPENLKMTLANGLLDISMARLYPALYGGILEYVQNFTAPDIKHQYHKYKLIECLCASLTATRKFLDSSDDLPFIELTQLAMTAVKSVEFHKNIEFLKKFIDLCSDKLYDYRNDIEVVAPVKDCMVKLLACRTAQIQERTYRLCYEKVIENIGTKINPMTSTSAIGTPIYFLIDSKILIEIAKCGLKIDKVKMYARDILVYILKCDKIVVRNVWDKCLEAIIQALPYLICYAESESLLGQTLMHLIDPDTAEAISLPPVAVLKSNVQLMFHKNIYLREEAVSRICWLFANQKKSIDLLPKFNRMDCKSLINACVIKNMLDVNKIRKIEHTYLASSLKQVLELLNTPNIDPIIRRSTLNQINVMSEDYLLHNVFLEFNGVEIVLNIMKNALNEKNVQDEPSSVIPIVNILKNLALCRSSVAERLGNDVDVLYSILRALFMFCADYKLRHDATILLFIIIFKNEMEQSSSSVGQFSLADIFDEYLLLPFRCHLVQICSNQIVDQLTAELIDDDWCCTSIRIQWNADLYGGIEKLIALNETGALEAISNNSKKNMPVSLKLTDSDLFEIRSSSIHYSIRKYLCNIQNASSHGNVLDCLTKLSLYLNFSNINRKLSKRDARKVTEEILAHAWETTFARFLDFLPASEEDMTLLGAIIHFLTLLQTFHSTTEGDGWIKKCIQNPSHGIVDLLTYENTTNEDSRILAQKLLNLISTCVKQEQHFLDYIDHQQQVNLKKTRWSHLIKTICENLKLKNAQNFYNLAFLGYLVSSLLHLTASLGWSDYFPATDRLGTFQEIIFSLYDLLMAFNADNVSAASGSVMGLGISRNILLILNHILAELQNAKIKNWERCFFDHIDKSFKSFLVLWKSRDVVVRAAAVQLFSNLATSSVAAKQIVDEFKYKDNSIWKLTFDVLSNHKEAGIVRENATVLLANLIINLHFAAAGGTSKTLSKKQNKNLEIISLLTERDFCNDLEVILLSSNTFNQTEAAVNNTICANLEKSELNVTTPGLIKSLCVFLSCIFDLEPDICSKLCDKGLVKLIFKSFYDQSLSVTNSSELALYCNILEMNCNLCIILKKICTINQCCVGTLLRTRDCLSVMFSLLNSRKYNSEFLQLINLRNNLWSEIFKLTALLLSSGTGNKLNILIDQSNIIALNNIVGTIAEVDWETFMSCLCESLLNNVRNSDLSNSALILLVSMLRIECYKKYNNQSSQLSQNKCIFTELLEDSMNYTKYKKENCCGNKISGNHESQLVSNDPQLPAIELCQILLDLYEISKTDLTKEFALKKSTIISALSGLICISSKVTNFVHNRQLTETLIKDLKNYYKKLSLESNSNSRTGQDRERLSLLLREINDLIGLLTNLMLNDAQIKLIASNLNLADLVHKLWIWFAFYQNNNSNNNAYTVNVLQLLFVFSNQCPEACKSFPLTNSINDLGPRKVFSNASLLHTIITLTVNEMNFLSRNHDLKMLQLSFDILTNCAHVLECRLLISKSNMFQSLTKLHQLSTKRQKLSVKVEFMWLEFLEIFTQYSEGQAIISRVNEVLELLISLAHSTNAVNRQMALVVLRNLLFCQINKQKLLTSGDFLHLLQTKLVTNNMEETKIILTIIWILAANNQKAKLIFKSSKLYITLGNILKQYEFLSDSNNDLDSDYVKLLHTVLHILRGNYYDTFSDF